MSSTPLPDPIILKNILAEAVRSGPDNLMVYLFGRDCNQDEIEAVQWLKRHRYVSPIKYHEANKQPIKTRIVLTGITAIGSQLLDELNQDTTDGWIKLHYQLTNEKKIINWEKRNFVVGLGILLIAIITLIVIIGDFHRTKKTIDEHSNKVANSSK